MDSHQTVQEVLDLVDAIMRRNRRSLSSFALEEQPQSSAESAGEKRVDEEKLVASKENLSAQAVEETTAHTQTNTQTNTQTKSDEAAVDETGKLDEAHGRSFAFMPIDAEEASKEKAEPTFFPMSVLVLSQQAEGDQEASSIIDPGFSKEIDVPELAQSVKALTQEEFLSEGAVAETAFAKEESDEDTDPLTETSKETAPFGADIKITAEPAREDPVVPPLHISAAAILADETTEQEESSLEKEVFETLSETLATKITFVGDEEGEDVVSLAEAVEEAPPLEAEVETAKPTQKEPQQVPQLRFSAAAILADVLRREEKIQTLKKDVGEIERTILQSSSEQVTSSEKTIAAQQISAKRELSITPPAFTQERGLSTSDESSSMDDDDDYPVLTDVVEEGDSYISRFDTV